MSEGAGNFAMELAEARVDQERDASVMRVRVALSGTGRTRCRDCGGEISLARRQALPSAQRCIDCAAAAEVEGMR